MTTAELQAESERLEALNAQLKALLDDKAKVAQAVALMEGVGVNNISVHVNTPQGESLVVQMTGNDGSRIRLSSQTENAELILNTMLNAGLDQVNAGLAIREADILEQLGIV